MRALRAWLVLSAFFAFTFPLMPLQLLFLWTGSRYARTFPNWYHRQVCRLVGIRLHIDGSVAREQAIGRRADDRPGPNFIQMSSQPGANRKRGARDMALAVLQAGAEIQDQHAVAMQFLCGNRGAGWGANHECRFL